MDGVIILKLAEGILEGASVEAIAFQSLLSAEHGRDGTHSMFQDWQLGGYERHEGG